MRCKACSAGVDGFSQGKRKYRKVYGTKRWQAIRARVLRVEPRCRRCRAPATDVDHIVPLRVLLAHGRDPYDPANLQPLCGSCHRSKTGQGL
jgi:5-methylcytosine-specific restriction endonuclease McrA